MSINFLKIEAYKSSQVLFNSENVIFMLSILSQCELGHVLEQIIDSFCCFLLLLAKVSTTLLQLRNYGLRVLKITSPENTVYDISDSLGSFQHFCGQKYRSCVKQWVSGRAVGF